MTLVMKEHGKQRQTYTTGPRYRSWGLAFVLRKGEARRESEPPGVRGVGAVDFSDCGLRRHFLPFSALQEMVLRMREAERKSQAFSEFVFQIEALLLAIYYIRVSSQAHSVLQCWGKTLGGHGRGWTGKRNRSTVYDCVMSWPVLGDSLGAALCGKAPSGWTASGSRASGPLSLPRAHRALGSRFPSVKWGQGGDARNTITEFEAAAPGQGPTGERPCARAPEGG